MGYIMLTQLLLKIFTLVTCTSNTRKYLKSPIDHIITNLGNNIGVGRHSARSSIGEKFIYLAKNTTKVFEDNNITSIASFKIFCKLGRGHNAAVYKVQKTERPDMGRFYAMKVTPAKKVSMGKLAMEYEILEKFHHPFIMNVTYIFRDLDYAFAVTDILTPFKPFLKAKRRFTDREVQFYLAEVALAVLAIHSKGVAHNDVDFSNRF